MKSILTTISILVFSSLSFAGGTLICKEVGNATAQGYEVRIQGKKASLEFKGSKLTENLVLKSQVSPRCCDIPGRAIFSDDKVNGYQIELVTGGFAGLRSVKVSRGGVAGMNLLATLRDCR